MSKSLLDEIDWETMKYKDSSDDSSEGDWWIEQYANKSIKEIDEEIQQYEASLQKLYAQSKTQCDADFLFWFDVDVMAINHDIACLEWVKEQRQKETEQPNKFNVNW